MIFPTRSTCPYRPQNQIKQGQLAKSHRRSGIRQNHFSSAMGNHKRWRIRVCRGNVWEHRRIADPQTFDAMHFQLAVDGGSPRIWAHSGSATRMKHRTTSLAEIVHKLVISHVVQRRYWRRAKRFTNCWSLLHPQDQTRHADNIINILLCRQIIRRDCRCHRWIR